MTCTKHEIKTLENKKSRVTYQDLRDICIYIALRLSTHEKVQKSHGAGILSFIL